MYTAWVLVTLAACGVGYMEYRLYALKKRLQRLKAESDSTPCVIHELTHSK